MKNLRLLSIVLWSFVGAQLGLVFGHPLADWMYLHFEFMRYHPVIVVTDQAPIVTPVEMQTRAASATTPAARSERSAR